ncbi:hypothetical protein EDB83DRAFT_2511574 [Lactarius deliciosus]|nr:hypothetical protein EDB83DRAFT_2527811 [Lactarius deliciosus]KAH9074386.1 hypothetical protein EDB83DRAFT_2516208 [Lactarius deliciosus]KAH9083306.1 hypothetical protein EDB83DRAFT_2511574 [Lactarius deliciosus]
MSLIIKLGDLYSSRRHERTRDVVKAHVWAHFVGQLKNRRPKIEIASVRPTGWHLENNGSGWHVTVDFTTRDKVHVTTHHVYYDARESPWMTPSRDRSAGIQLALDLGKAESWQPHHLPRRRPLRCLAATLPLPPPTSPPSPFHHVTVAFMTGAARVALVECLGAGSGILTGVVIGTPCRAPLSGDVRKPYEGGKS